MKVFVKKLIALTIIISSMVACQDSSTEDLDLFESQTSLKKEEVLSMVETMIISYPITAITNSSSPTTLTSDFDVEDYAATTERPQITFPFDITINGETITVNDKEQLRSLIRRSKGKKKPEFVFPISVELVDGSAQEIADKEAFRAYLDSLDEGVKPIFVFPLSLIVNGATVEVSDENELQALKGKSAKGRRPNLVFPLSVVLADGSTQEIANKDEFKAYLDTLADGVKPEFVFPISVEKNGETVVVNSQEELDALVKKPKKGKKPKLLLKNLYDLTI